MLQRLVGLRPLDQRCLVLVQGLAECLVDRRVHEQPRAEPFERRAGSITKRPWSKPVCGFLSVPVSLHHHLYRGRGRN